MGVRERPSSCVCGREWWEAPYIVLEVGSHHHQVWKHQQLTLVDQNKLPAKLHLAGKQGGFGRTPGSAGPTLPPLTTVLLWYSACWVLMSDGRCRGLVGQFGLVCGPPLLVLRKMRSSVTSSAYSSCFLLIPDLCS